MEKYWWSIAADFTYDWIAISPRHNTLFARYRSVPSIVYERGRSSVDTNNRALADRRRTTDCFRRHDCCHEPIKCYENTAVHRFMMTIPWRGSWSIAPTFSNTVIFSKVLQRNSTVAFCSRMEQFLSIRWGKWLDKWKKMRREMQILWRKKLMDRLMDLRAANDSVRCGN